MKFNQKKDGSCDIIFSWREIFIIVRKRKLTFSAEGLRHFGNILIKIVADWNSNFNEDLKNKQTELHHLDKLDIDK
tara:strand:- start:232 stop:459 length:228 start_codon:yes stop_codon:yes gene_type:complete